MNYFDSDFQVPFRYRTVFTDHVFDPANSALADAVEGNARVLFVYDANLNRFFPGLVDSIRAYCTAYPNLIVAGDPVPMVGGEAVKSIEHPLLLCEKMLEAKLCRQSYLIEIGGGALLDAAGFAASIFHRGIRQIRIPTTALAQCDSGVGVKNSLNACDRKNLFGVFAPPHCVINDRSFLRGLPAREVAGAAAEAVKVAIIRDADFFRELLDLAPRIAIGEENAVCRMVRRSAELHIRHIAENGDPFEMGSARPLDFGHWAAHRLEDLSRHQLRHGEAVAVGLQIDTLYATLAGIAAPELFKQLEQFLAYFPFPFPADLLEQRHPDGTRLVVDGVEEFREHLGGELHITLPVKAGSRVEVTSMELPLLETAIAGLIERKRSEAR